MPSDHPRAQSLHFRHKLVDGMKKSVVTPSGLCAHGRGEAFDYLLGEETIPPAIKAMEAAVAAILNAQHPILSVNGNLAALAPEDVVEFSKITGAQIEINIFYQAPGRIEAITQVMLEAGATHLLGTGDIRPTYIKELASNRRIVDPRGIAVADVVVVPIEDGDRTEALVKENKFVIAIDLNPLSRTAQKAHITIVDNVIRCFKRMSKIALQMKAELAKNPAYSEKIKMIIHNYNQQQTLAETLQYINSRLTFLAQQSQANISNQK